TLTATHGKLQLSTTAGLTFTTGSGFDALMTFSGNLARINAALLGMRYLPAANYFGPASVQIDVDDQGNTGAGGAAIASATVGLTINPVNDAPTLDLVGALFYTENDGAVFIDPALTVEDVDDVNLEGATIK